MIWAIRLLGLFFALAALITALAGLSLAVPGTPLDAMWAIKPREHIQMLEMGWPAAAGFVALSPVMAAASWGLLARRPWARVLAIVILVVNGTADLVRGGISAVSDGIMSATALEGLFGVAVTGFLVWWLCRSATRSWFQAAIGDRA